MQQSSRSSLREYSADGLDSGGNKSHAGPRFEDRSRVIYLRKGSCARGRQSGKKTLVRSFLLFLDSTLKDLGFRVSFVNRRMKSIRARHVLRSSFLVDELLILWTLLMARAILIFKLA